ncbi:MAG: MBL fold metallo-hydrolase [Dehalococcoidia bacterium]|jgi:ribonuclease Z|nr:MBL fold metallo-hydrolase [Dehalococcoidia bacterium]MDP7083514.1 MBL fold metallo-hydrolase [Dehalococcoidia bacterium]MDP7199392.1 MBL fold metallo-hydrolase [Dehalococcoidia bacterium]MDP7510012.1 MBL fold metallo-hydrolase [Dehalococcoidia bacterium]HJN86145.1 MBL fold metallo-hydrolase [Dehalococcoidia bacterium]
MPNVDITFLGTGAGMCVYRNHTAIVLDCPDGTRLLLDTASGNSVMRQAAAVGMMAQEFEQVLLTHHHGDHMGGLPYIQGQRSLTKPEGPPLQVHSSEEALEAVRLYCKATRLRAIDIDQDGATTRNGHSVFRWRPTEAGQRVDLGATTWASSFPVDHLSGSVGWRVEAGGVSIVFSGDTRFSTELVEASRGARLLIHEALDVESNLENANGRGHSVAAGAGRAAAMAGVEELIITHIDSSFHLDPQPLIDDARRYFDGPISVASDLYRMTVATG